jgi:hypothetical protein
LILENNVSGVVTIFCDSALKYLSTDLCKIQEIAEDSLANEVEIVEIIAHK